MDKKFPEISAQQMQKMASSPAAQQLMAMLQQSHSAEASHALASAKNGDMAAVQRSLAAFLADPKAKALLQKLQEEQHG